MSEEENSANEPNEPNESMSADDLAILQAFDSMEPWQQAEVPVSSSSSNSDEEEFTHEDMLLLFASEMDEDIGRMKQALSQLEQGDTLDETCFTTLHRAAHKIRGAAGAMECHAMASIARHIEEVVAQITTGAALPFIGVNALVHAVLALEVTLQDLLTHGQESSAPLQALEHELQQLSLALQSSQAATYPGTPPMDALHPTEGNASNEQDVQTSSPLTPSISVEVQRFERLVRLSEGLAEAHTPLENAQEQVESALRELHTAQSRLQQLERALTDLARPLRPPLYTPYSFAAPLLPASSLVERMLSGEAPLRKTLKRRSQGIKASEKTEWDELELDSYSESDKTVSALRDAIAQVTLANTHVQRAYAHLSTVTQQYVTRATQVHSQLHLLRLTPLSALVSHLRLILEKSAPQVLFEVTGEETEVDQDILNTLVVPLSTLLRTCVVDIQHENKESSQEVQQRVWLFAHALGNEVTLEIGFSMAVQGGALNTIQPSIQRLRGTIELRRNHNNGVSFFLRFPRSPGTVRGLLVRVGDQQLVLPFSQVQRVSDEQHQKTDLVYHLHKLLNFPHEPDPYRRVTPLIILPQGRSSLVAGILVDEVMSDVTVVVKPLPRLLQRPGVAGTVLDDRGHVLLLLDIPALLKHYYSVSHLQALSEESDRVSTQRTQHLALIADDSTFLRKSLSQTLELANFITIEARDGLEALEMLTQNPPDVFLLDMEMPNMNGYELLDIMHIYPELNDVKIIVLTSRATEKHKQRALERGAHAYLTKPCPRNLLLETIEKVLQ